MTHGRLSNEQTVNISDRMNLGFARPSRYEVEIAPSDYVRRNFNNMMLSDGFIAQGVNPPDRSDLLKQMRNLGFSCSAITLPGVTMGTFDQNHGGATRKLPTTQAYNDVVATFYASRDHFEYRFFHNWMKLIVNYDTHTIAYHKDYASTIFIRQLDERDKVTMQTKITEAYPIQVSPLSLTYAGSNTIEFCSVTFAWR